MALLTECFLQARKDTINKMRKITDATTITGTIHLMSRRIQVLSSTASMGGAELKEVTVLVWDRDAE